MEPLTIILEGDGAFADAGERLVVGRTPSVAGLADGTRAGRPSVAITCETPDGKLVLVQTTLALFLAAADALKAKYGDPR